MDHERVRRLVDRVKVLEISPRERVTYYHYDLMARPEFAGRWSAATIVRADAGGATYYSYDRPGGYITVQQLFSAPVPPSAEPLPAAPSQALFSAASKADEAFGKRAEAVLGQGADADDARQQVLVSIVARGGEEPANPAAYVQTTQTNALNKELMLRKKRPRTDVADYERLASEVPSKGDDAVEAELLQRELWAKLRPIFAELSPLAREVVVLVDIRDLTSVEAAVLLHSTDAAVRQCHHRALRTLLERTPPGL